jgi:outer membrane protein assembly factor BamB
MAETGRPRSGPEGRTCEGGIMRERLMYRARTAIAAVVVSGATFAASAATDWPAWRGPEGNGVSYETDLPANWSKDGTNLAWSAPFVGRSTPVALDGQVCVIGRTDDDKITRQEVVACFDAESGAKRWEHRFNVYHTTVPYNRVGWASLAADPETGNIYAHGVAGQLIAYDRDGNVLWSDFTAETLGRLSGYGGRTQTPVIDGDLLLIAFVTAGWGEQSPPRQRVFAFDKRTGEIVWSAAPGGFPKDMNTQSVPVVATIEGRRVLINGNADGTVYGLDVKDGSTLWSFRFGKRGLNSTPVVAGNVVFIGHSEENLDTPDMGRLVAFRASGTGDITDSAEVWRINQLAVGFPSPVLHDDVLYAIDNSANLYAIEAKTGKVLWEQSVGTVGKGSAVWADGKLYVTEVNGRFTILKPGKKGCEILDVEELEVSSGRYAEIYGSAAVAYGRVFFTTEGGIYALAKDGRYDGPDIDEARRKVTKVEFAKTEPAAIQVVPAEVYAAPGEPVSLHVRAVDRAARPVRPPSGVSWTLEGITGEISKDGTFVPDPEVPFQAGKIVGKTGGMSAEARVRVVSQLPWSIDFESMPVGKPPATWIGAGGKFAVAEHDGGKVLLQDVKERGLQRSFTFLGGPDWSDYTVQMDFWAGQTKRRRPDVGMLANGYTLDLKGIAQELEVRSWTSELRMAKQEPFEWEMETWYTMKMRVDVDGDTATIRGKVWRRGQDEPAEWSIVAEDPVATPAGGPGIIGYAPAEILYDNLKVTRN